MAWISTVLAILKFIALELPKFLEAWGKYKKDVKYQKNVDKIDAALKDYKKTISLEALKELENSQK